MTDAAPIEFPCKEVPPDPGAKLLGIYPMRQEGLFLQRVRVPQGRLTAAQLRKLAAVAAEYTPEYPLHLTTRQDVEIHGLRPADVPVAQRAIAAAGLTCLGAAGDTLRNVTACPGNGFCASGRDVTALAEALDQAALELPFLRKLPRKFKASVSGCAAACGRPWINDVGFIACDGGVRAVVAGSLGARPATGVMLERTFAPSEAVALFVAALKLFDAEGDRTNRGRARLRHVRERLGDAEFTRRLMCAFEAEEARGNGPKIPSSTPQNWTVNRTIFHVPMGNLDAVQGDALADAVSEAGAQLRIGFEHDVFVYGPRPLKLDERLAEMTSRPSVVSCPGNATCRRGIGSSRSAANAIASVLSAEDGLRACVSGCPNNCAHAAVADLGFIARVKTIDGKRVECFQILAGGERGAGPKLARELHPAAPTGRLVDAVLAITRRFGRQCLVDGGPKNAGFSRFVEREEAALRAEIELIVTPDGLDSAGT